jgi:hypothetical protein
VRRVEIRRLSEHEPRSSACVFAPRFLFPYRFILPAFQTRGYCPRGLPDLFAWSSGRTRQRGRRGAATCAGFLDFGSLSPRRCAPRVTSTSIAASRANAPSRYNLTYGFPDRIRHDARVISRARQIQSCGQRSPPQGRVRCGRRIATHPGHECNVTSPEGIIMAAHLL